jgi:hypothetical protein
LLGALRLFLLFALPLPAQASGLPFLRLSAGARAAALAEATSALAEVEAANPAGLQAHGRRTYAFGHASWIQDIRHEYLNLVFARQESTWGLSGRLSRADGLERRAGPTAEPLGTFGVYEGAVGLACARPWGKRARLGLHLQLLRQSISTRAATGGAVDLGLLCDLARHWRLGAALRNLGRMNELDQRATKLPAEARLGLAYYGLSTLFLSLEAQAARGHGASLHLGAEYAVGPLRLRSGYQTSDSRHLALGLGLLTGSWSVDYAFVPFGSGLGHSQRLSLQLHRSL